MATLPLVQKFERVYRFAADHWCIFRRQIPPNVAESLQNPVKTRELQNIRRPRLLTTANLSSNEILDVFEELRTTSRAIRNSEVLLKECNKTIESMQKMEDMTSTSLARLDPGLRGNFIAYVEEYEEAHEEAVTRKRQSQAERTRLEKDLATYRQSIVACLQDFYPHAQDYFDRCLDLEFDSLTDPCMLPPWGCTSLRTLLDVVELNRQAAANLRTSRYNLAIRRSSRWRAERAFEKAPQTLKDALATHLDSIRTARLENEKAELQQTVHAWEVEIADRKNLIERFIHEQVDNLLDVALNIAGRYEVQDEAESKASHNDAEAEVESEARGTLPNDREPDPLRAFREARSALERLQTNLAVHKWRMRDESSQVSLINTFVNSSPTMLAERATARQLQLEQQVRKAEQDFAGARDQILALGGRVPSSPRSSPSKATREFDEAGEIRGIDRRRTNMWRFSTQNATSPSSRVSKRSQSNLSALDSRRSRLRSWSGTPSTGRRQKLVMYAEQQERLREEGLRAGQ